MKTVAIIGGTGQMGQFFKRFFRRHGYTVIISGRSTKIKPREAASKADVVIVSVPIEFTCDVIKEIGPSVREDALLMDFTSIKKAPLDAMLKYSKSSVIGLHPVFGPGVKNLRNQTIVMCLGRGEEWFEWAKDLFIKGGAKLKISTAEEHDKMMSVIQGVIHFSTITISHVLKDMGIDVKESQDFSSPIYKLRLDMVGRILNQDPSLYANIEILNDEIPKALKTYLKNCNKLYEIIEKKDTDSFIRYFKEGADYLGDFKEEAEEYSNYLIQKLVRKKRKKGEVKD